MTEQKRRVKSRRSVFKGQIYSRHNYFIDGRRKIDFVLVADILKTPDQMDTLAYYMVELSKFGIYYEISPGAASPNLIFIKLHCPRAVLEEYADFQHFVFDYKNQRILQRKGTFLSCGIFNNVTTIKKPNDPVYKRALGSLSSNKSQQMTSWERSTLVYKILSRTRFGDSSHDEGFDKLIGKGIIKDAYPMHDGPFEWHDQGPLTDRQLLYRYWANMKLICKHQPIPLIFKYFGPEVAFYFAFIEFYTKKMVVPAILGLLLLIFNAILRDYFDTARVTEICDSDLKLCALCLHKRVCKFTPVSSFCLGAYILPVFDNIGGGIFAIFMGFWSIVFIESWRRQEYILKYRWNLINVESDTAYRPEFLKTATHMYISSITGEKEYYIPLKLQIINTFRTLGGLTLMFSIVLLLILANIIYRLEISKYINDSEITVLKRHKPFFIMSSSAILSTVIITYLAPYFSKLSVYLTKKENPKTQFDYLNACIYKVYATSFVNGYFPFFYVAFVKNAFFTHPGDPALYQTWSFGLRTDICNVNGCAYALTISLIFFFALKNSLHRIFRVMIPIIKIAIRRKKAIKQGRPKLKSLPTWERDYALSKPGELFTLGLFMNCTMQYGYVLFFISALQLTPMMALITSFVNIRVDAINILKNHRRPVARRLPGIGAWNNIFNIMTFIGTASNAFVIAFTSDLWQREIYRHFHSNLTGYVNSTLSEFSIEDYEQPMEHILHHDNHTETEICVYRAKRYPYWHEKKYQRSDEFWHVFTYQLGFVVIYEQLLWFIISMVSIFRESIPKMIKDHLRTEKFTAKKVRLQLLKEMEETNANVDFVPREETRNPRLLGIYTKNDFDLDNNYYIP